MPKFESVSDFLAQGGIISHIPIGKSAHISAKNWRNVMHNGGQINTTPASTTSILDMRDDVKQADKISYDGAGRRILA